MIKLKNNNPQGSFPKRVVGPGMVYLVLTSFTLFLLVSLWNSFMSNPTVTSLENTVYPVTQIPFPGISFCNINKISKKRAQDLADYITNRTGENPEKIMKYIKFLGYLYDADYDQNQQVQIQRFQAILDSLKLKITKLMRSLMTPCEEFLQSCHWQGVEVNCSDIIFTRLTFEGYCCTFNYVKNTSRWWSENKRLLNLEFSTAGIKSGLSVVINNNPNDYFHTTLSSTGVNVHIFIPTDYPDKSSGNLIESFADIGTENFFEVIPTTVAAVKDVMNYHVDKRNCRFKVEELTQFGVYSQSDCFVDCRVRSMTTLCECIPFTIPFSNDEDVCTLCDLPCLSKYKTKWASLVPQEVGNFILKETEEGLSCPNTCYPSCEETLYAVGTSSGHLFDAKSLNTTSIHIFYGKRIHNLFKQDVVHYWFEMLSYYGGIFGLIMGLSIISIVEGITYSVKYVISKW